MKYLYYINKFVLITTALLYITIFLGLYAQIVLGIVQLLTALILLFFFKTLNQNIKNQLYYYYAIVIVYGLGWLINWPSHVGPIITVIAIMIIPMSIAIYFFIILSKIYKPWN